MLAEGRRLIDQGLAEGIRVRAHLTQTEIATDIGVSGACVSRWEHGARVPRGMAGWRYCALLIRLHNDQKARGEVA